MNVREKRTESGPKVVMVAGGSEANPVDLERAEQVGRLLAQEGAIVLTGGGSGVMEAASRGARSAGGTALAILPGSDASESPPNRFVSLAVFTGMGDARNAILVRTADAVIAIGGSWGTLSEIALASKIGKLVVALGTWEMTPSDHAIPLPDPAESPEDAVRRALSTPGSP